MVGNVLSAWRRRREARRARKEKKRAYGKIDVIGEEACGPDVTIPNHFRCPITLDIMKDPVILSTGITYDRESIEKWIVAGNLTCPITKQELANIEVIPNHTLRKMIQAWCVENMSFGIERIPTPRIPVSRSEVVEILETVSEASGRGDADGCRNLVTTVRNLTKDSEKNKSCFIENGASRVLASSFEGFANGEADGKVAVLEEVMSTLTSMRPFDAETKSYLASKQSLNCLVCFLMGLDGDLGKKNAVLLLKELVTRDQRTAEALIELDGSMEALFNLVKQPIFTAATKASLFVIFQMIPSPSKGTKVMTKLEDFGLVSLLIEMLPGADRSLCEKALAVLDKACCFEGGRDKAYAHALTIPVLLKKMHRVSTVATSLIVSILWNLCKNEKEDGRIMVEAIHLSGFQKLLLLLQVGCDGSTKEKATELLKMLNVHRNLECIESADFKDLERTY